MLRIPFEFKEIGMRNDEISPESFTLVLEMVGGDPWIKSGHGAREWKGKPITIITTSVEIVKRILRLEPIMQYRLADVLYDKTEGSPMKTIEVYGMYRNMLASIVGGHDFPILHLSLTQTQPRTE